MAFTLNITTFRTWYPAFSNATTYPDATVTMNWDTATLYISAEDYGWLSGSAREKCIYLMTAHIMALTDIIASGQNPGLVTGSSIDRINVTLTPPPLKNQFQWWLSNTAYGAQLLALLQAYSVGGLYVGGRSERSSFRKSGGEF